MRACVGVIKRAAVRVPRGGFGVCSQGRSVCRRESGAYKGTVCQVLRVNFAETFLFHAHHRPRVFENSTKVNLNVRQTRRSRLRYI